MTSVRHLLRALRHRVPQRIIQWVPPGVPRRLTTLLAREARAGRVRPALSVVVPVYNVEAYLPACLTSVLAQDLQDLEVIVVDDGSTDSCPEIIEEFARRDPRIRAFRQPNAGQGPARNFGVQHSRGRFLTFADADDIIPPGAYRYLVKSLQRTGSDFSTGSVMRMQHGRLSAPEWTASVHGRDRLGITIDDFPIALLDVIACNRMFRREFWVNRIGGFRGGSVYEDHVPMVAAYVRASSFDVLARVTYHWRIREDKTSTGQQKHDFSNLRDRIQVKTEALEILRREASPSVLAAWVGRVVDTDLSGFIRHAVVADEHYRETLQAAISGYLAMADAEALQYVRVRQKLRNYLVVQGAWDRIEPLVAYLREVGSVPPTVVVDGRVLVSDAVSERLGVQLPAHIRELSRSETALRTCLTQATWDGPTLRLTGWSYIRNVDFAEAVPETTCQLVEKTSGEVVQVPVEQFASIAATRWSRQPHAGCDTAGFQTVVDVSALVGSGTGEGEWQLRFRVGVHGVYREGVALDALRGSSAMSSTLPSQPIGGTGLHAMPRFDPATGFGITLSPSTVVASELSGTVVERTFRGQLTTAERSVFSPRSIRATSRRTGVVVESRVSRDPDGGYPFAVPLPASSDGDAIRWAEWQLHVVGGGGGNRPLEWPPELVATSLACDGAAPAFWRRAPQGSVRVMVDCVEIVAVEVGATDDEIRITVEAGNLPDSDVKTARLSGPVQVPLMAHEYDPTGGVVLRFSTSATRFGLPAQPLPSGEYRAEIGSSVVYPVWISPTAHPVLPIDRVTARHRVLFATTKQGQLSVTVDAPLTDAESGAWAQRRLKEWYATLQAGPDHSVLFHNGRRLSTDDHAELCRALLNQRPDLTVYWGVHDLSESVPEGALAVVIGTKSWYRRLATSIFVCTNVDLDPYFAKRPFQRCLRTWPDYDVEPPGRTAWARKGFSPQRIAAECTKRCDDWDALVAPTSTYADLYRQEFDYTGDVLVTGCPRMDAIHESNARGRRATVRRQLGILPDQWAVLYVPSDVDVRATMARAGDGSVELDIEGVAEAIGPHALLLRDHSRSRRRTDPVLPTAADPQCLDEAPRAQVIDVTDYPRVGDLLLAADVAILDYGGLRFDWAATGKPMLFFVPDADRYLAARPQLSDFASTAPGPLLSSTEAVTAALHRVDRLSADYADARARLKARFHPLDDGQAADRVVRAFFGPEPRPGAETTSTG
ncbi:MAG TPA: CDP-glycerol glycerophosphotransferase family protein [Propionibacteriaceae bacterium]|nr:CDP-glycerol glycerophosphotransferase family protein [Propionibacteriaceae bacterium]